MKLVAANLVFATDTFSTAFTNINKLLYFANTDALTANSTEGSTTGNAALVGTFTASNVAVTGALRGGTLATPAALNISSNAIFNGALATFVANLTVNSISTFISNSTISGNSSVAVLTVTGNSTVSEATLGGTNLKVSSIIIANGVSTFNNTFAVVSNTSISGNSTVLAFGVTTNSTVTNTYIAGTNVTVNAVTTMLKNVFMSGDLTVTGSLNASLGAANCLSLLIGNSTVNVSSNSTVLFIGNSTVSITMNSTTFSGTANNATNLNGVAAASYVQNTDSRTLSGNLVIAGTNTVISSNLFITGTTWSIGNSTVNAGSNSTVLFVGNSTVSMTINTSAIASQALTLASNTTITGNLTLTGTISTFAGNSTVSKVFVGNSTVGNVGIRNTAPTVALHIGGNYQTDATNLGTINSTSNNTISFSGANYFRGTIGGACTLTFSNIPAGAGAFGFIFALANVGSNLTWPAAVKWAGGTAPTFSSNSDIIVFMTHDAGTTINASLAIKDAR